MLRRHRQRIERNVVICLAGSIHPFADDLVALFVNARFLFDLCFQRLERQQRTQLLAIEVRLAF